MKRVIEFFVNNSLLVNLITIIILIAGLLSVVSLQKEVFPKVDFEMITVNVTYPGSSPEDSEKLLTISVERALKEVDGIEELNTVSGEGYSITTIKVDPDYDVDEVHDNVNNAIDRISDLPSEAEEPVVTKLESKQRAIIKIAITGDDEWRMREVSKRLRDKLELINGIARVNLDGYREEVLEVTSSPSLLNRFQLTLSEVVTAIRDNNINLSAGTAKTPDSDVLIRTKVEKQSPEELEKVIIRSNASGRQVQIGSIGKVERKLEDVKVEERLQGKKTIFLDVLAKEKADVIDTTERVKKVTDKFFEGDKYADVAFEYVDELAFYVNRRLSVLTENGLTGMVLVFFALLLFMNFRVSLMTSLGAPLAFLVSFFLMDMIGVSLNMISLFGLILVLGMLVDDSIIVAEQFYQYVEEGMKPKEAATKAAFDTLGPVTATVLTTMVAFGSLFFVGGIMGKFLWPVPAVVIICLAASWFECFFILPSHLAEFVKPEKGGLERGRWYRPLSDFYERSLALCLRFYKITIFFFIALFAFSLWVAKDMRKELFPGDDVRMVYLNFKGEVGTPLAKTSEAIQTAEKIVLENLRADEFENVRSMTGALMTESSGSRSGSHYGSVILYLTLNELRERSTDEIMKDLVDKVKPAIDERFNITIEKRSGGPPKGKPVNVELFGNELDSLLAAAKEIQKIIQKKAGVLSTELDFEEGKTQLMVDINESEARRLGLSNRLIAAEIRRVYEGEVATTVRKSDEDIDILVRYDEPSRKSLDTLDKVYILNPQGNRIALRNIARFREVPGAFVIRRFNRKRSISVQGSIDLKETTSLEVNKEIEKEIQEVLKSYPDITYLLAGENKDTEESTEGLMKAGVMSLMIIFFILVVMFGSLVQPLIVISAIPMGMIGVIFTFYLFNEPISFMAGMGIIGLVGVVVNDSIVLTNFINVRYKETGSVRAAIKEGAASRFRAVILTTLTTVAGLLPIAHASGGDPFLKPMALSFAYGLLFSSMITLIFVPCSYEAYRNTQSFFSRLWRKLKRAS